MSVGTILSCPSCTARIKTKKEVSTGTRVVCPKCASEFSVTPSGEHLVDAPSVATFEDLYGGEPTAPTVVLPRIRDYDSDATPAPKKAAKKGKAAEPDRKAVKAAPGAYVGNSRSMVVSFVVFLCVGAGLMIGGWVLKHAQDVNNRVGLVNELKNKKLDAMASGNINKAVNNLKPPGSGGGAPRTGGFIPLGSSTSAPPSDRTVAPAALRLGVLSTGVQSATVGEVKSLGGKTLPGPILSIRIRVTHEEGGDYQFEGWESVVLRDGLGNRYNPVIIDPDDLPPDTLISAKIASGMTVTDTLLFEDLGESRDLELDIPYPGGSSTFKFFIPAGFVKGRPSGFMAFPTTPAAPKPVEQAKGFAQLGQAPPPAPPKPQTPVELHRAEVQRDWKSATAKIDRVSKGMDSNEARRYRRDGRTALVVSLAKKYELTPSEVKGIVGY